MRKGLLNSFESRMGDGPDAKAEAPTEQHARKLEVRSPTMRKFSQAFEDLTQGAPKEIETSLIGTSAMADRFNVEDGLDDLIKSIKENGQKIAVHLRPASDGQDPGILYEPVYGRRRIAAARALGVPVKAYISDMTDEEALMAQGIENSARKDTSFIERAIFARDLLTVGIDSKSVMSALSTDKATLSRMNAITSTVPADLIYAIGPASGSGRRVWADLKSKIMIAGSVDVDQIIAQISDISGSDARLSAAITQVGNTPPPALAPIENLTSAREVGAFKVIVTARSLSVKSTAQSNQEFLSYLSEQLDGLHEEWVKKSKEKNM